MFAKSMAVSAETTNQPSPTNIVVRKTVLRTNFPSKVPSEFHTFRCTRTSGELGARVHIYGASLACTPSPHPAYLDIAASIELNAVGDANVYVCKRSAVRECAGLGVDVDRVAVRCRGQHILSPFYPLARHPGPFWYLTSSFCHVILSVTRRWNTFVKHLRVLHGDVVRRGGCFVFSRRISH